MLIVWSWLPCNHSGAGILMRRLFSDYTPDRLWALTSRQSMRGLASYDPVPPPQRQVPVREIQIHRRWIGILALFLNYMLIPWTVWRGVQLVRTQQVEAIFTVPWDHFTIAAYFLHKITSLPLYVYVMDDHLGARRRRILRPLLYSLLMPVVMRSARRVWGVSDEMCEYLNRMYNADSRPLLPLVDLSIFSSSSVETSHVASVLNIVFTGAIYSGQADSVRRLVHVLDRESQSSTSQPLNMHLTLYTMMSENALRRMGMLGKNVSSARVTNENIPQVLSKANIAFVPISFDPAMRHFAETSFPTKIAEYVASGVPILAHVPPYSTVARYCHEHGCGLVVDEPNEESLHDALILLSTDTALRTNLSMRALEAARRKHDATRIASDFLQQLRSTGT